MALKVLHSKPIMAHGWLLFVSVVHFYNLSQEEGAVYASSYDADASLQPG